MIGQLSLQGRRLSAAEVADVPFGVHPCIRDDSDTKIHIAQGIDVANLATGLNQPAHVHSCRCLKLDVSQTLTGHHHADREASLSLSNDPSFVRLEKLDELLFEIVDRRPKRLMKISFAFLARHFLKRLSTTKFAEVIDVFVLMTGYRQPM